MTKEKNNLFGLLGKNIEYSFSRNYFNEKFKRMNLNNFEYRNFDLSTIDSFLDVVRSNHSLKGLNVTIPYKESIISYLDSLDEISSKIKAVNTIKITKEGLLKGYNTDAYGFEKSLLPLLKSSKNSALILGTGGASKAIAFVLNKLNINHYFVSRNPRGINELSYNELSKKIILNHNLIINCTPLGTSPNTELCPNIPYQYINNRHIFYDLIYNPAETTFLYKAKQKGAVIKNGYDMLKLQAEESWRIWNS